MRPLEPGHPRLAPVADLAVARRFLVAYHPADRDQLAIRDRMLAFIERYPEDAHLRSRLAGHLTGSALVVDPAAGRVLLTHHRKLDRWLQPGGHCDGDANLAGVALREAVEESGIVALRVVAKVIDVDIHTIPERPGEPEHLHLDSRFLVFAPPGAEARASEESHEVRWLTREEAFELGDDSLRRVLGGWRG